MCRDPANSFDIHEDTCQAKAVVDEHLREQSKAPGDPEPGLVLSARLDDTPSVARPPWEL